MSLHMSKYHIVGNLMHWLNYASSACLEEPVYHRRSLSLADISVVSVMYVTNLFRRSPTMPWRCFA